MVPTRAQPARHHHQSANDIDISQVSHQEEQEEAEPDASKVAEGEGKKRRTRRSQGANHRFHLPSPPRLDHDSDSESPSPSPSASAGVSVSVGFNGTRERRSNSSRPKLSSKRSRYATEDYDSGIKTHHRRPQKRQKTSNPSCPPEHQHQQQQEAATTLVIKVDPYEEQEEQEEVFHTIRYWAREGRWPPELAQASPAAELGPYSTMDLDVRNTAVPPGMQRALARKKTPSVQSGRKRSRSNSSSASTNVMAGTPSPSDQAPRDVKSAPYRSATYETLLETKNSFLRDDDTGGLAEPARDLCRTLLDITTDATKGAAFSHPDPQATLFDDRLFDTTCRKVSGKNEARVIRDISPLVVPSAEILATRGAVHLDRLVEAVNQGWNNAQPLLPPRPQPDYSVGFGQAAFTPAQLDKLAPFVGDRAAGDQSLFMGTHLMFFPFLACEVKCGDQALAVADRQNAHSMTLAVRGVVELFRLVGRARELDRRILAFSFSHDDNNVRIYGHYAVMEAPAAAARDGHQQTTVVRYHRHKIHAYDFTVLDGRDKWTAYRITRYIYDKWMPRHVEAICSAIDQLPPAPPATAAGLQPQQSPSLLETSAHGAWPTEEHNSSSTPWTQQHPQPVPISHEAGLDHVPSGQQQREGEREEEGAASTTTTDLNAESLVKSPGRPKRRKN